MLGLKEPRHCEASSEQAAPDSCPPEPNEAHNGHAVDVQGKTSMSLAKTRHLNIQSGHSGPNPGDQKPEGVPDAPDRSP